MKKIVVVGSNGLVGSHFVELFHQKYQLLCVNKDSNSELTQGDETIDSLVFLAQSKEYTAKDFTEDLFNTNVALVRYYLQKFAGKCKKVILFSTGSVYQETDAEINENSPLMNQHLTPYVASKLMAELLAKSFAPFYPNINIVRPFCIYGKGQKATMLFSRLINQFKNKSPIEMGQGEGILFNPVHAEDVAYFIDYLIEKEIQGVEYFNIAGPETLTLKNLIEKMEDLLKIVPHIVIREWPFKKVVASTITHSFNAKIKVDQGLLNIIHPTGNLT